MSDQETAAAVAAAATAARSASDAIANAGDDQVDAALRGMARLLSESAEPVLAANAEDQRAARDGGMGGGLLDRLRLDPDRLRGMAEQLTALAGIQSEPTRRWLRDLDGGLALHEWRRPVGVIGANFEARPNVVVDIASQLVKSHNAGVLRTGSAALGSAVALLDRVVAPALAEAGIDPAAIQLVRRPGRESAEALVRLPELVPLVILRGSGDSTRHLARQAALSGVRTLAHADGGGVLYLHAAADRAMAADLVERGLDRLGVCNRLNLLLIDTARWDELAPAMVDLLGGREPKVAASLPPHPHPLGYEWALDDGNEATVTIAPVDGPAAAARVANEETSGLAAAIVTDDPAAAAEFLGRYAGTGGFWNATTRLLDGFKLLALPETGINIDRVPGPRGPVTYRDLCLRQYVVLPAGRDLPVPGRG
ncbi:aldehyde dehydrogenase family protein [Plantactinospora sp. KBS50]|uniref:aldehyde dehydrogenase family protein n=1 Tax=Plantactinospora sp. KBS50 TaxID=2024580 RepID=UPI000BAB1874|nr:aldehyde dehydrogenase family protein [Plantactinospora sp. KBS50]ASW56363.1 gamma-glutamyl phosphate reductase [Plantactinospora sp. KBS50]